MAIVEIMAVGEEELVARSARGDREAFGGIVARYQSMVAALAFSATGSISLSEDISQEVFVAAWRDLGSLREAGKLRPWLCGIARNLIHNYFRRKGVEPRTTGDAGVGMQADVSPTPYERAVSEEEAGILWRSIAGIPAAYREPLVMFYREGQSVEGVARALDLTEEAVKQRLSRGRRMLQEEVLALVEGTLGRSNPGRGFTQGGVLALPPLGMKGVVIGGVGGAGVKSAGAAGLMGVVLSPLMIIFGNWMGYRLSVEASETEEERGIVKGFYGRIVICVAGYVVAFVGLMMWGERIVKWSPPVFSGLVIGVAAATGLGMVGIGVWASRREKALVVTTGQRRAVYEYRSSVRLLGVPLVHIQIGRRGEKAGWVKGWVAIGDKAAGLVFAFGGVAVAPVAIGGCAMGMVAFGGVSVGVLSIGGFALGVWALGSLAVGWEAFGAMALGVRAAVGGIALGHQVALGGIAEGREANNRVAEVLMESDGFYGFSRWLSGYSVVLNGVWVLPLFFWMRMVRRKKTV